MKDSFSFILISILQRCAFRKSPSSVRIVEKCELANICCHHLVPANDWGQQGQETDANDVFFNFARMQAAESHTYALCNYLVKQPQMKTYLIFYFLFHTEPTGLLQLESDCTKAPNPNQKSLTNIHSMNNKRYEALLDGSYFCWTSMENADIKFSQLVFFKTRRQLSVSPESGGTDVSEEDRETKARLATPLHSTTDRPRDRSSK